MARVFNKRTMKKLDAMCNRISPNANTIGFQVGLVAGAAFYIYQNNLLVPKQKQDVFLTFQK